MDLTAIIQDQKATNIDGGTFAAGSFLTRDLNTIQSNQIAGLSLAANVVTLPIGTYEFSVEAPAQDVNRHKARIFDVTNNVELILGTSAFNSTSDNVSTVSLVSGLKVFTTETDIRIEHQAQTQKDDTGFGVASDFAGTVEIYTVLRITKVA